jgi:hypothetical protein
MQSQSQQNTHPQTVPAKPDGSTPTTEEEIAAAPANRDRGAAGAYRAAEERNSPESQAADHLEIEKDDRREGGDNERA